MAEKYRTSRGTDGRTIPIPHAGFKPVGSQDQGCGSVKNMLTFVQNRENFSLFFACTGGGPIREAGRTEYAVMSREAVHCTKMGFCSSRISPRPGGPSERVWHGGTMTVTVSAGIRHFPDFVLYLAYRKGGQYVQEIYPG